MTAKFSQHSGASGFKGQFLLLIVPVYLINPAMTQMLDSPTPEDFLQVHQADAAKRNGRN